MGDKTNILIVDDSRIFRSIVAKALAEVEDVQIVGSVMNGVKAMEFIEAECPDLVSLDVEMPVMDGLETLAAIQKFNASRPDERDVGVIMLSSATRRGAETTIEALEGGAFDFVEKPQSTDLDEGVCVLRRELIVKINHFVAQQRNTARKCALPLSSTPIDTQKSPNLLSSKNPVEAIVIGVSTGGPKALAAMLPRLTKETDLPILIVQHMPATFTKSLAKSLDLKCSHTVAEAEEGQIIAPNNVYVAPGGRHMLLRRDAHGELLIGLSDQPKENGCRPAVDVLFRSAAASCGGQIVTIVLTGMGSDGTKGLASLKRAGAHVVVQDEESSVVWGMPGSAVASGNVDEVVPLLDIPEAVANVMRNGRGG